MDGDYITRKEFEAYGGKCASEHKRLEDENERQNHRLQSLEGNVQQINELTATVREMNANMANMLEEMKRQGRRLDELEKEPVDSYRQIKQTITTAIIGTAVGAVVTALMMLL
ncbi:MAG: hypothetical protein NC548_31425 [Lachnospiraceae bacterium]|nr:hypothetical protein [Bacteroides fragilis]MCM1219016.1 hypothetical protein [Lachnospiraceae bacterium]